MRIEQKNAKKANPKKTQFSPISRYCLDSAALFQRLEAILAKIVRFSELLVTSAKSFYSLQFSEKTAKSFKRPLVRRSFMPRRKQYRGYAKQNVRL